MFSRLVPILVLIAQAGCSQSDFGHFPTPDGLPTPEGPGSPAWGSTDITCVTQDDCAPSETCENNICMPTRCTDGPYASSAPIGKSYIFFDDKEILAADANLVEGRYWLDGYLPSDNDIQYKSNGSWSVGTSPVVDIAGGNILGTRPDGAVAAVQGSSQIEVRHDSGDFALNVGFQPIAVATGDVDEDQIDEVIALGAGGQYAICDADEETCDTSKVDGASEGIDAAAADIDGDGVDEPIFLVKKGKNVEIVALNTDSDATGQVRWVGGGTDEAYKAISAGVLDGSGAAKIVALLDGGYFGWVDDRLDTLTFNGSKLELIGSTDVDSETRDIEVDDLDSDGRAEIAVLFGDREIELRRPVSASNHTILTSKSLTVTQAPSRLGFADLDGDSPMARQISGPELVPGGITPVAVMQFPPYSQSFSDGTSYLFVGNSENIGEDFSDSMSVRYGLGVGFEAKIPGVVRAGFIGRFGQEWSKSTTTGSRYTIGSRFIMNPNIDLHGNDFSVVMLSSGCFHTYGYEIDDPKGVLDKELNGSVMGMMVPVGGQMTVWSSKRYNALAKTLGNLPIVETRVRIGDPNSYPSIPETSDGQPVPEADMVFPRTPSLKVSDVGVVGYWLSVADYEVNDQSTSIDISGYGNVGFGPVSVNVDSGLNQGRSHSITVGTDALFGGGVPAVPDDPDTPEDEHAAHGFTYSPKVHREYYTDGNGNQAGYYVLSFTVGE